MANHISLPSDIQNAIVSFAAQYSVDSWVAQAVAQVSSGGQQFFSDGSLVVTPFGVGVMGVSKTTATALGFDATTQLGNIQAGVAALAAACQEFIYNYPQALAAYVTSAATVQKFNGVPPLAQVQEFVYNVCKLAAQAGSIVVSSQTALQSQTSLDPTKPASITAVLTGLTEQAMHPLAHGQKVTSTEEYNKLQADIEPILQRNDPTLQNTAWFADTGLVTGNSRIRASVQPVTFIVYLDRNDPSQYLKNPADGSPIEIQLNTSLSSFEISSKHVFNRTPSRTGMHITLWGMEPDLISGSGTTGVFMNQFGLTDFMSTQGITDDVLKLLSTGQQTTFSPAFNSNDTTVTSQAATADRLGIASQAGNLPGTSAQKQFNIVTSGTSLNSTGLVSVSPITGDQATLNTIGGQRIAKLNLNNPSEAFRVAAQDAFVELLKLFQMNGNIWYYAEDYASGNSGKNPLTLGTISGTEQITPTAWSKKTGTTSFQQHARNNDVMSRGYVAMHYRNNVYLGYFKSLSWTQDAESPFQWKFNFSFQVEKTYTALYYANVQVTQAQTISQNFQTQQDIFDGGNGEVLA